MIQDMYDVLAQAHNRASELFPEVEDNRHKNVVIMVLATSIGDSDTLIARVTGYSRGYVIRRKKLLQASGHWGQELKRLELRVLAAALEEGTLPPRKPVTPSVPPRGQETGRPMRETRSRSCLLAHHYDCRTHDMGKALDGFHPCQCPCHTETP